MTKRHYLPALCILGVLSATSAFAVSPTVLYNAAVGSLPENQSFLFHGAGTETAPATTPLATEFNTSSSLSNQGGWATAQSALMNASTGYTLQFSIAVKSDDHSGNANRAGFDIIAISSDNTKALELAFWPTQVFALNSDVPTFSAGETDLLDTTSLQNYSLSILGTSYTLYENTSPILTGSLRNYTSSTATVGGIPIYAIPGFLFMGDDTTSASADSLVQQVSILPAAVAPEPASLGLLTLGAMGLLIRRQKSRQI